MLTHSLSSRYLLTSPSAFPAAGKGEAGVLLSQLGQCQGAGWHWNRSWQGQEDQREGLLTSGEAAAGQWSVTDRVPEGHWILARVATRICRGRGLCA